MAAVSSDLATAFFGLARRHAAVAFNLRAPILAVARRRTPVSICARAYAVGAKSAVVAGPGRPAISTRSRAHARRFAASAAATDEGSDLLTKIPPDDRIPATIITGFLGSGKYGEVDIDGSLVAAKAAGVEDIVMLNNGCLCCTVRGDLVRMISELVSKKKGKFDHIVIETTGLANPAPIIQTFYAEDQIFNDVKLDGVVTMVDAKHAGFHLGEKKPRGVVNEAVEQIAYADRIIVNKVKMSLVAKLTYPWMS
ncbi:hypothetical protein BHE74_00022881 [Ensete ventricosum]|uniref:Uncharacterized protein n=1 Tax=Ensete ventricosum TaxID=4639 RepID=A0A426Y7J2_ENSVE|nr:hypothetical protein B296_00045061 [Ensete ventricosum]RWV94070.1 hypothetical protein GW17_00043429 [Ensete ventricosum]RWW69511.1 hypothetical protein BHE74_00022881 [Ensete ventricosum]RZR84307.1 hypothetical protein BHM03_00011096 [Ensete ventricosum]